MQLTGGNLNYVWRIPSGKRNIIVKQAPPFIASQPEVPLNPDRIRFEAKALSLFLPDGRFHDILSQRLRVPEIIAKDLNNHLIIMEDFGDLSGLADWLKKNDDLEIGNALGTFIGRLHLTTHGDPELKTNFNNHRIQRTRFELQYDAAEYMLKKAGIAGYGILGEKIRILGRKYLETGICLTMGDLWPPSILVGKESSGLIDWEFCHFGYPAQDIGHLIAHLQMQSQCVEDPVIAGRFTAFKREFLTSYIRIIENEPGLWNESTQREINRHAAAEILARTMGRFKQGYLYDGLPVDHPLLQKAVQTAVEWIQVPLSF